MCGIAGKLTTGEPVERELLERMAGTLHHRGPDGGGVHIDGPVALAMTRLAVIDPEHGQQPLYSEDGRVTVVCNGEIYGHRTLRRELAERGHRFAGGSDAEVIVHLWEELGPRCVERLRGMFAFALWDDRRRELLLARDRIGKKPLLYHWDGKALRFGSEPRAILQDPAVPRDVDPAALDEFLVLGYVPHDRCAFAALRKLPPGSILRWSPGSEPRVERYWRLEHDPRRRVGPAEATELVREKILEATRLRLDADVPLGAFLSGGIDSSVVVAAMAQTASGQVRTFSAAFAEPRYDESAHARRVAAHLGTEHHELVIGPPDRELLERIAWHAGEPFADPAAVPTFQLSELTRAHVTVALNGDGGDESFAGYRRYRQLAWTRPAEAVPLAARRAAAAALARRHGTEGRAPGPRAARLATRLTMSPPRRYADLSRALSDDARERLYGPRFRAALDGHDPLAPMTAAWDARPGLGWVDRAIATDLDTYLADDLVAKVDLMSMAHGLEVRSPLLDHELMELAARLPARHRRAWGLEKALLRDAASAWLPAEALARRKQGFAVPVGDWLRGPLRALPEDVLLDPAARERGIFRPAEVQRMVEEHRSGRNRELPLWTMLQLELWFRTCAGAEAPVAPPAPLAVR